MRAATAVCLSGATSYSQEGEHTAMLHQHTEAMSIVDAMLRIVATNSSDRTVV
jgi:hypothetical protein